jgi:alkylated DNA repair protein (DNA oxidative demethylase)
MDATTPSARGRIPSSRRGGVPRSLPPAGPRAPGQLALGLDCASDGIDTRPVGERTTRPLPDVTHVRHWLTPAEQRALAAGFRSWARPPAGLRQPRVPSGELMSVQSVCLGWHWQPYAYSRTADDTDRAPVKPLPPALRELARRAAVDAGAGHGFHPDAAIVNLYESGARLGLHQDGEEPSAAPVVTLSLGDTCTFRMAGVERRTAPFTDVRLESGDLLVFWGRSRRIYHGVPRVFEGTGPAWLDLPPGRVSITLRETGFA